ncbi:helix-turn-helix domain-containing protein [Pseudomonas aeruginosa]|uniref:helix-turn-helix domain-containing protein n=1 Tax=Pseudomonas aeruginosa TaxID=287 RepID=UPI000677B11C|nr:XRE family transcriptional regulator [Pseudomonas aeruginosa]EJN1507741.1 helix-turn-helix domain-containing protein [Pseudomonas aeruginosa]ELH7254654.1 helix-turn-helix domain-containing protein [Pseudomonas aeruginosa]ELL4392592.1 helix-turn-helix domain-containing protein [Pseudomonas aeruginosa]KAB0756268.1 helix-turn-helix domain-containing protein [Pseudomonas aeruginosa]MBG4809674.1 helix-turn-helix domain-containing protein [Pseudomonas aeruginosa]
MNTLGSRIAHYRSLKGISQAKLAKACGWASQSRIGNYEKDTREPSLDDLELIAQVLDVTVAELIGSELTISGSLQNVEPALQPSRGPQTYPLISWVAAGQRADSPDNFVPGVAEDWLPSTENAGPHGYWLLVKGPSMTSTTSPSFPDGTPILIRPEGFDLISGKFYIARHRDGETTFKQYIYDAGREYLVPLNAKFETVEMDDAWDIIGRVIDQKAPRGVL